MGTAINAIKPMVPYIDIIVKGQSKNFLEMLIMICLNVSIIPSLNF